MDSFPNVLPESSGIESLEECQKLEDIENELQRNKPTFRYTKDQLLKLRSHPLSLKVPKLSDNLKSLCGKNSTKVKDKEDVDSKKLPLKKHAIRPFEQINEKFELKKTESIRNNEKTSASFRTDKPDERKVTDPATRLRKEQDICLSPQRKSFNTGCFVQNVKCETASANNGSGKQVSESNGSNIRENRDNRENREVKETRENRNAREMPRRIGSGRIISSEPPFMIRYPENRQIPKEKPTVVYKCTFQGKSDKEKDGIWDRPKNTNYYDKRRQYLDHSYDQDESREPRDRVWDQQRNNHFFDRRRHYDNYRDDDEEREPEWMKDGPGSKNDMIELKGFDESVVQFFRNNGRNRTNLRAFNKSVTITTPHTVTSKSPVNGKESSKRNSESDNSSVASDSVSTKQIDLNEICKGEKKGNESVSVDARKKNESEVTSVKPPDSQSIEINLDDIFKEPLPEISSNGDINESAGSKFTRWFKRDDGSNIANMSSGITGSLTAISKSTEDKKNVASASLTTCVANDSASQTSNAVAASNLMDLLRGTQESVPSAKVDVRVLEATGKLHSLEEIEAKLRGTDSGKQALSNAANDRKKKEEESEAFKKLLFQAVKSNNVKNSADILSNDISFQKLKIESMQNFQGKSEASSLLCNGDSHSNFPANMVPPQVSRMSPMNAAKHFQLQQSKQQEMLSKILMSSTGNYSVPPPSNVRVSSVSMAPGPYTHLSPEIQTRVNEFQVTRDLMQRSETINILRALKHGDLTIQHVIDQYKKTTPSQTKFRESVLCALKIMQPPSYLNNAPFMGTPVNMPFNVPPPSHSPQPPFGENIIQQMMMSPQYRTGIPNIVYQRDFSAQNQNTYQNNINKKPSDSAQQNVNPTCVRMHSPLTVGTGVMPPGNNSMNSSSNMSMSRDNKSNIAMSVKMSPTAQSHSFTPLSVLRKLSAEKENLDALSKDNKDSKLGEKNALVPYSCNTSSQSCNVSVSPGLLDHFNSFGSCIPPPAISGQYFVGNMIRPSNPSAQIPIFGNPPPNILTRLPISANTNVLSKGNQKTPTSNPHFQQLQTRSPAQITLGHDTLISQMNRLSADVITSSSNCVNQTVPVRNTFMNSLLNSGDEPLNRLLSSGNVNQSFPLSASNNSIFIQNMMSVEEIERIQQSVRN